MTYYGTVKNGVVVLDPKARLPEGAEVEIRPLDPHSPTWADVFRAWIGQVPGLPRDSAENHDHYLYGAPKK